MKQKTLFGVGWKAVGESDDDFIIVTLFLRY